MLVDKFRKTRLFHWISAFFTHCSGSTWPSGARKVQTYLKQSVRLCHLGVVFLKMSGVQILKEHIELILEQFVVD